MEKPRVLVKGLAIPENVDEFICENYKKFDITLSSVGEVSDHLKGLLSAGKVRHIYHWANPYVVSGNLYASWAMERDSAFDFTIITKPSELAGKLYEICLGDEDVLFAAASGSLPICGIADLDYEEGLHNVGTSCPNFGSANTAKELREAITSRQVWTRYKEDYGKVRAKVEARLTAGPFTMSRYFSILLGPEKSEFRNEYLEQKKKEAEEAEAQATESRIDNVVNVDFNKGTADA